MQLDSKKILLIANPVAQNGKGAAAAEYAERLLKDAMPQANIEVALTKSSNHGSKIAADSKAFDAVLALGGDGLIHEVVNGLMDIPRSQRPVFAVLPVGTGNDYARTLGMSFSIEESISQLISAQPKDLDLGLCNGEYFVETLSFGLDAAIALDTMERRKRTGKTGTALFLESGIDVLLHQMQTYPYELSLDGGQEFNEGHMLLFAVQVGPTYGGGFTICPEARIDDGLLDICIAHPPLGIPKALMIFLLAKNAHHTGFKQVEFQKSKRLLISFNQGIPPTQIDGEPLNASELDISCMPSALEVLTPAS